MEERFGVSRAQPSMAETRTIRRRAVGDDLLEIVLQKISERRAGVVKDNTMILWFPGLQVKKLGVRVKTYTPEGYAKNQGGDAGNQGAA